MTKDMYFVKYIVKLRAYKLYQASEINHFNIAYNWDLVLKSFLYACENVFFCITSCFLVGYPHCFCAMD